MSPTTLATQVRLEWKSLRYQGFTVCAHCGDPDYCCGVNTDSRICLGCFEFVFAGRAPNMRRRKRA